MSQKFVNSETSWISNDPFIRLYHTLANFSLLETHLSRGEERSEVVFRNSELTLRKWERVTDLFNDKTWTPKTLYLPSLHPDFEKVKDLPPISRTETPFVLFDRFQKAKSQMEALRTWCINDQAHKGKHTTALAVLKSQKQDEKFSSMSAFPSHLLYLWHFSDSYKAVKELFQLPLIINPTPASIVSELFSKIVFRLRLFPAASLLICTFHNEFTQQMSHFLVYHISLQRKSQYLR